MLKYLFAGILVSITCLSAKAQRKQPIPYKDVVFQDVAVEKDLSYAGPERRGEKKGVSMLFDLYQPKNDRNTSRPLIIWMHGGGFKFGSRKAKGIQLWCKTFSARGYVCAAINYRLGRKNLTFNYTELVKNCFGAVQDLRQAIGFFKKNYARFRIDTSRIVLAGNSAGGMIALQAVYNADTALTKQSGSPVAAIINFWGGIFDLRWLSNARVPIVSVHGKKDRIVPYDHKSYPLYGSFAIHKTADSLHIPNSLKSYDGYSHELQKHFNPFIASRATQKRWMEAGEFAADFLYGELFGNSRPM